MLGYTFRLSLQPSKHKRLARCAGELNFPFSHSILLNFTRKVYSFTSTAHAWSLLNWDIRMATDSRCRRAFKVLFVWISVVEEFPFQTVWHFASLSSSSMQMNFQWRQIDFLRIGFSFPWWTSSEILTGELLIVSYLASSAFLLTPKEESSLGVSICAVLWLLQQSLLRKSKVHSTAVQR